MLEVRLFSLSLFLVYNIFVIWVLIFFHYFFSILSPHSLPSLCVQMMLYLLMQKRNAIVIHLNTLQSSSSKYMEWNYFQIGNLFLRAFISESFMKYLLWKKFTIFSETKAFLLIGVLTELPFLNFTVCLLNSITNGTMKLIFIYLWKCLVFNTNFAVWIISHKLCWRSNEEKLWRI